jgi:hypothetical protein
MKRYKPALIIGLMTSIAVAALPPRYQNAKDLDVMTDYIKQHDHIIAQLKSIDFRNYIVYYGDCRAIFGRKAIHRPAGMVGPAAPLEFKREICEKPQRPRY